MDIQGLIIPCANLDNGERVISDRSLAATLGVRGGGAFYERKKKGETSAMLPEYISAKYLEPFITDKIRATVSEQVIYKQLNGVPARGIRATILPEICDIWVQARQNGAIKEDQYPVAEKAYTLLRAFASVGIIALVDEATGFQYD